MKYVLALDQGTTSSRALLFDARGQVRDIESQEFAQHFPAEGHVEHVPGDILRTQLAAAERVLARNPDVEPACVGLANQRETTLLWDRATGEPLHNAIVWQDRRTAGLCERLRAMGLEEHYRERTGLLLDPYFSATKLAWLLEHVPGARKRAQRGELAFGTVDSWLVFHLTGGAVHATDASNASRTLLYDIHRGAWSDELLEPLGIPRELLPEVRGSSGSFGIVAPGLPGAGAPISGVLGDQQAATLGQRCLEPGLAKCTYGTGCFLLMNVGDRPRPSRNRLLTTVAWSLDGDPTYALEGSVFVGGAAVQWLRDGLGLIERSEDVEALARSVPDAGGVVFVPALTGLGAPHWDPRARGSLQGLTRATSAAHLARAALEGIAHQVADLVEAMNADAEEPLTELRVDGGAAGNDLLMQLQADLLGVPVVRPQQLETTALGAAYAAGRATGALGSDTGSDGPLGDAPGAPGEPEATRFEPELPADARGALRARWKEALRRCGGWAPL